MNHNDHMDLLRAGILGPGGTWADLGAGTGAFTLALAELLGPQGVIFSVDRDRRALSQLRARSRDRFPGHDIRTITADFTGPLEIPPLDGVVMANSLHFLEDKEPVLQSVRERLGASGRLILVEYNVDMGNRWVPFPISFQSWEGLARRCGFSTTRRMCVKPSSFLQEVYSALSMSGRGPSDLDAEGTSGLAQEAG